MSVQRETNSQFVGVKMPPSLAAEMDRAANESGSNRSAIIRAALTEHLNESSE